MTTAKDGDTVKIHYTGTLADGSTFDSSKGKDPLQFTLGSGQVIPGFEKAVIGMEIGATSTTTIVADEAYGQRREEYVQQVPKTQIPEGMDPQVGQMLQLEQPNGQNVIVTVTEVAEETITLDANHQLAGKDLTFEINLVEIV